MFPRYFLRDHELAPVALLQSREKPAKSYQYSSQNQGPRILAEAASFETSGYSRRRHRDEGKSACSELARGGRAGLTTFLVHLLREGRDERRPSAAVFPQRNKCKPSAPKRSSCGRLHFPRSTGPGACLAREILEETVRAPRNGSSL